jgi:GT2 family glycosyltransferase
VREAGGFRPGLEEAHEYDLMLRCSEQIDAAQIGHIPRVLYHARIKPWTPATIARPNAGPLDAALRAVAQHFERTAEAAQVEPYRGIYRRARYASPANKPLVSLVISTGDRVDSLRQCLNSILDRTNYQNFDIIVVNGESRAPEALEYAKSLHESDRVSILSVAEMPNNSRSINAGVAQARGEFIGLLHADLEVINSGWLSEMVGLAARPQTGAVGSRLWHSDDTLQHAGMILGTGGVATLVHGGTRDDDGYFCGSHLIQNFSAVTGAGLLVRREIYLQVGGLDEALTGAFNDIDFCLRLREAGFRIVWTPHAQFYHYVSARAGGGANGTKQGRVLAEEQLLRKKWGGALEKDPFYNPNFSLTNELFTLAFPPRVRQPWKTDV